MSRFQESQPDRNLRRRWRSQAQRRSHALLGLDLLENRQLLAVPGSAPPAWHPTSQDPLNVQNGPLANAGTQIIQAYQDYLKFKVASGGSVPLSQFQPSNTMLMTRSGLLGVNVSIYGDTTALVKVLSDPAGIAMTVTQSDATLGLIEGYVSPANLVSLAQLATTINGQPAGVVSYGPMDKPMTSGSSTQAVKAFQLPAALQQFPGTDGSGVTLGIPSDSISLYAGGLNDSVAANAAPPMNRIKVLEEGPYGSDEGRAMLEVAYDIAPGANYAFHTAFAGELDFAQGIKDLSTNANAQVIVDDVSYFSEPAFQPGPIEQAVTTVVKTQNRVYYSSARNAADQGYLSSFRPVTDTVAGVTGMFQNFNPMGGKLTQLPVTVTHGGYVNFQYDQPFYQSNGVTSQVDVYFLDSTGKVVASGTANNIATQTPQQAIDLTGFDGQTLYMAVNVSSGPAPAHIFAAGWAAQVSFSKQFGSAGGTSYPTTTGHNAPLDGIGVGAVDVRSIPPFSNTTPIPSESFSSAGPRILSFDAKGNPVAGGAQVLQRPQISAPDGIQTTFFIQGYYVGNEKQPSFFGTSCAAPDAAALAVLMRQLAPEATQQEILNAMIDSSISINGKPAGAGNWDPLGGSGLIQAPAALNAIAPPVATNLTAVVNSGPTVTLSWTVLSPTVTSCTIERLINGEYVPIGTVDAPTTQFTDTTVQPGGIYTYLVIANTSQGPGKASSSVTVNIPVLPATPLDLQVLGVNTNWVLLGWSAVAPPVDGYVISRRTGQNPFAVVVTLPATATQYVDTNLTPGTSYDYQVLSYNLAGKSAPASVTATTNLTTAILPPPWIDSDIGSPTIAGAAAYANGVFTINTRSLDPSGSSDQLNFIHQTITGDSVIVARVAELGDTNFWAKAGLMIRSSLDPASTFAFASLSPGGGSRFQWRSTTGQVVSDQGGPELKAPAWLKLVREGNTFFAYGSKDGSNWGEIGAARLNMPATVEIGMAVTSYTTSLFNTSKFDNVSVAKLDFSHGVAINTGGTDAGYFQADAYSDGGFLASTTGTISTTGVTRPAPEPVYQTAIQGTGFSYTIPNLTPGGTYQVRLHFAEFQYLAAGQRQFNVAINGQPVLTNFDIFKTAGGNDKANVQEFLATADASGQVTIAFTQGAVGDPQVNGIELVAKGVLIQAAAPAPTVDNPFTGVVATFNSLDLHAVASDFVAAVDWGDGTVSNGTVVVNPSGGFQVLGTHTYTQVGPVNFSVTVTGAAGEQAKATGVATVLALPLDVTPQVVTTSEGVPLTNTVLATFLTQDPLPSSSYLVSILWADGSSVDLSSGSVTQSGNTFSVLGTHTYAEQGTYVADITITVAAHNGVDAVVVPVEVPITVTETPLVITPGPALAATIGVPFTNAVLATFTDPAGADDPSYYLATADWGDGTTSPVAVTVSGEQFTILGSHTYQALGNQAVVVTIRDQAGDLLGTVSLTATVNQIPLVGGLNASSDSGASNHDGITSVKAPTYQGTAPAGSVVTLKLQPSTGSTGAVSATGQADTSGHWTIVVPRALADGKYTATASTAATSSNLGSLCIDTAGAKILSVQLFRGAGQIKLVIQDALGGLDPKTLLNPALYSFVSTASGVGSPLTAADIQVKSGAGSTAPQTVILTPLHGAALTAANYSLTVYAANQVDLAGNQLDGKFSGKLPTGTGSAGTDFAAIISGSGSQTTVSAIGSSYVRGVSPVPRVPKVAVHPLTGFGRVAMSHAARPQLVRALSSKSAKK